MLSVKVHRAGNSVPATVSGSLEESDCAPHTFNILTVFALYQNVRK